MHPALFSFILPAAVRSLPKRPGPYITTLLLVILFLLTLWLRQALNSETIQRAIQEKAAQRKAAS